MSRRDESAVLSLRYTVQYWISNQYSTRWRTSPPSPLKGSRAPSPAILCSVLLISLSSPPCLCLPHALHCRHRSPLTRVVQLLTHTLVRTRPSAGMGKGKARARDVTGLLCVHGAAIVPAAGETQPSPSTTSNRDRGSTTMRGEPQAAERTAPPATRADIPIDTYLSTPTAFPQPRNHLADAPASQNKGRRDRLGTRARPKRQIAGAGVGNVAEGCEYMPYGRVLNVPELNFAIDPIDSTCTDPACNDVGNSILSCFPGGDTVLIQDQWSKFIWVGPIVESQTGPLTDQPFCALPEHKLSHFHWPRLRRHLSL